MRNLFANDVVALEAGRAISGVAEQARTLSVLSGRVWLTTEGVPDDHWLEAGDEITLAPHRLIVLEADAGDTRIRNTGKTRGGKPVQPWHALQSWIAGHFGSHASPVCSGSKTATCHAGRC